MLFRSDTVWGNVGEDGNEFRITNDASSWNMWYPGFGGCYYTELNTTTKLWSALYIPQLTVSGGISGEMTYDRANNRWMLPFSSNASEISIRLTGEGKQYNFDSGTTDNAAVTTPVGFGGTASNLLFGTQASDLTLSVPTGGEYTLMVDLSNPLQFVCTVSSGSEEPEEISKNLWLSGIDDGISEIGRAHV